MAAPSEFYLIFNIMFPYSLYLFLCTLPTFIHTCKTIARVVARFRFYSMAHTRTATICHSIFGSAGIRLDTNVHVWRVSVLVCRTHALTQSNSFPLWWTTFSLLPSPICEMKYFWYTTQGSFGCDSFAFLGTRWLVYVYGYLRCSWSGALCLRHVYAARNLSTVLECTTKAKWHLLSQNLSLPWPFRIRSHATDEYRIAYRHRIWVHFGARWNCIFSILVVFEMCFRQFVI